MTNALPLPLAEPIARPRRSGYGQDRPDPLEGQVTDSWQQFLSTVSQTVSLQPVKTKTVNLTGQNAAIAATDLTGGAISTGLYRVTFFAAITTADGVASSLTVTLSFTNFGLAKSQSGSAITGDTNTTTQSGTLMIYADSATPITYSTAYVSTTPGKMHYALSLVLETVSV